MGAGAEAMCPVVAAVVGGLEDVPAEGVWGVAVVVAKATGVEVTALVAAEATGWDAVVLAGTTGFLAVWLLTIVCSCCCCSGAF